MGVTDAPQQLFQHRTQHPWNLTCCCRCSEALGSEREAFRTALVEREMLWFCPKILFPTDVELPEENDSEFLPTGKHTDGNRTLVQRQTCVKCLSHPSVFVTSLCDSEQSSWRSEVFVDTNVNSC